MKLLFVVMLLEITAVALRDEKLVLYPKKGVGQVRLGKTTEEQLKQWYGNDYQVEAQLYTYIVQNNGRDESRTDTPYHYVNYKQLGLKFQFDNSSSKLIRIIALPTFTGRTLENVRTSKSTMGETLQFYGKPMVAESKEEIQYLYTGIGFTAHCNNCDKLSEKEINELKVSEIVIAKRVKLAPVRYTH